eukprot:GEMP01018306.1.p1 GENE.GEMP01018306.1~~GEMP01018306.1.p1  ORF type:complete len:215 (+),score=27.44 GEMP01018306.1:33-677(+)
MDQYLECRLKNVVAKLNREYGVCIDLILDTTLTFSAACTIRNLPNGDRRPVIYINLRKINTDEAVIAHVVAHEYGHVLRGHLCQIYTFPFVFQKGNARTMMELQADEFAGNFVCKAYRNIGPVLRHIGGDPARKKVLLMALQKNRENCGKLSIKNNILCDAEPPLSPSLPRQSLFRSAGNALGRLFRKDASSEDEEEETASNEDSDSETVSDSG